MPLRFRENMTEFDKGAHRQPGSTAEAGIIYLQNLKLFERSLRGILLSKYQNLQIRRAGRRGQPLALLACAEPPGFMEKQRIVAIHDISCVGRCSLTVALPILSAAGFDTGVLPTAVLSTIPGLYGIYLPRFDGGYPPHIRPLRFAGASL